MHLIFGNKKRTRNILTYFLQLIHVIKKAVNIFRIHNSHVFIGKSSLLCVCLHEQYLMSRVNIRNVMQLEHIHIPTGMRNELY